MAMYVVALLPPAVNVKIFFPIQCFQKSLAVSYRCQMLIKSAPGQLMLPEKRQVNPVEGLDVGASVEDGVE
jgi:hypothetical protein